MCCDCNEFFLYFVCYVKRETVAAYLIYNLQRENTTTEPRRELPYNNSYSLARRFGST